MYGYFRIATSTRARVYLAVERQTLKTPNSTNYPLSPSITPHRIQNRIVFCSPGSFFITLCKLFKSDKAFWRNTRPRNRTNFVKKGSHIRGGGYCPALPQRGPGRGIPFAFTCAIIKPGIKIISIASGFTATERAKQLYRKQKWVNFGMAAPHPRGEIQICNTSVYEMPAAVVNIPPTKNLLGS